MAYGSSCQGFLTVQIMWNQMSKVGCQKQKLDEVVWENFERTSQILSSKDFCFGFWFVLGFGFFGVLVWFFLN